jgi:hypothetical protein
VSHTCGNINGKPCEFYGNPEECPVYTAMDSYGCAVYPAATDHACAPAVALVGARKELDLMESDYKKLLDVYMKSKSSMGEKIQRLEDETTRRNP